jgi:hypothetical protein
VARIDADLLAKVKAATLPICNALVDPSDDLMNTDRFVVGSNKYRQTRLIAFVLDDDARRRVHFTERFFNPELDWYTAGLTEPFNVLAHAQAATLIHEFAHQCTKAVDIASLEARRPFADLIATVTGYGAAMKQSQTQFQREALSLATPREELFARWNNELGKWVSLDSIPGTQHVGEEILKVTASKTMEQARGAFLNPTNPAARIDTILRNAGSLTRSLFLSRGSTERQKKAQAGWPAHSGAWVYASVFLVAQYIARGAIDPELIDRTVGLAAFTFPVAVVVSFDLIDFDVTGLGLDDLDSLFDGDPAGAGPVGHGGTGTEQRGSGDNGGKGSFDHFFTPFVDDVGLRSCFLGARRENKFHFDGQLP